MVSCYEPEPYGDTCPDGGVCSFQSMDNYFNWPLGEKYRFCAQLNECDPIFDTGCPENLSCYLIGDDFMHVKCLPRGTHEGGEICDFPNDCSPGYSCFIGGPACNKACDWRQEDSGCDPGYYCEGTIANYYGYCREEM
ncbi:hypothetical protein KKC45_04350 [Patescibacteria group bacterium]|nr:hypothetical protein [Patescibacteria group bacterium]